MVASCDDHKFIVQSRKHRSLYSLKESVLTTPSLPDKVPGCVTTFLGVENISLLVF